MRAQGTSGRRPPGPSDREVWRRSQEVEASADEAEWLLDLAAFAENRLDDDDAARVAARLARDPAAAEDVAAARSLAAAALTAADAGVIGRAAALVPADGGRREARVIAFPARQPMPPRWYGAATWSGIAAAVLLAGWLGFDLGSGLSNTALLGRSSDEAAATEMLDPSPPFLVRDLGESSQI